MKPGLSCRSVWRTTPRRDTAHFFFNLATFLLTFESFLLEWLDTNIYIYTYIHTYIYNIENMFQLYIRLGWTARLTGPKIMVSDGWERRMGLTDPKCRHRGKGPISNYSGISGAKVLYPTWLWLTVRHGRPIEIDGLPIKKNGTDLSMANCWSQPEGVHERRVDFHVKAAMIPEHITTIRRGSPT